MLHSYCITISLYFVMVILCVKRVYLVLLEGQASCTHTNEANQSLLTTEEMKRKIITRIESKIGVVWVMVLNATYINISVISRCSVLLVEETGVPGENHKLAAGH